MGEYGMNDRMPCGTDVARRRHLARAETCTKCRTDQRPTNVGGQVSLDPAAPASLPAEPVEVEVRQR